MSTNYEEFLTANANATTAGDNFVKLEDGNYKCALIGVETSESGESKSPQIRLKWKVLGDEHEGKFVGEEMQSSHNVGAGNSKAEKIGKAIEANIKTVLLLATWAGGAIDFGKLANRPSSAIFTTIDDAIFAASGKGEQFVATVIRKKSAPRGAEGRTYLNFTYEKLENCFEPKA